MDTDQLTESFENYLKSDCRFAVLLNGAWGVGKSHLVETDLKKVVIKRQMLMIRISAFGVGNIKDFNSKIASKLMGDTALDIGKLIPSVVGVANKQAGSFASAIGSVFERRLIDSVNDNTVIVIDDLERSTMLISELLGALNDFIEDKGCKLLLLADESKLTKKGGYDSEQVQAYLTAKEKVVGFTWTFSRKPEEIVDILMGAASMQMKPIISSIHDELLEIIDLTNHVNLRTWLSALNKIEICFASSSNVLKEDECFARKLVLDGMLTSYWYSEPLLCTSTMSLNNIDNYMTALHLSSGRKDESQEAKKNRQSQYELLSAIRVLQNTYEIPHHSSIQSLINEGVWDVAVFSIEYELYKRNVLDCSWHRLNRYTTLSNHQFISALKETLDGLSKGEIKDLSELSSVIFTFSELVEKGLIDEELFPKKLEIALEKASLHLVSGMFGSLDEKPRAIEVLEHRGDVLSKNNGKTAVFVMGMAKKLMDLVLKETKSLIVEDSRKLWCDLEQVVIKEPTIANKHELLTLYRGKEKSKNYPLSVITAETAKEAWNLISKVVGSHRDTLFRLLENDLSIDMSDIGYYGIVAFRSEIQSYIDETSPEMIDKIWSEKYLDLASKVESMYEDNGYKV